MALCDTLNWLNTGGINGKYPDITIPFDDYMKYFSMLIGKFIEGAIPSLDFLDELKFEMSLPNASWPFGYEGLQFPVGPSFASILLFLQGFADFAAIEFDLVGIPPLPTIPLPPLDFVIPIPGMPSLNYPPVFTIPDLFGGFPYIGPPLNPIPDFNIKVPYLIEIPSMPFPFDIMLDLPNTNFVLPTLEWPGGFGYVDFCAKLGALLGLLIDNFPNPN